jgi:hypothetical protein
VAKIFQRLALRPSASSAESTPTAPITQILLVSSQVNSLPVDQVGAISATANAARNGQYQWLQRGSRSLPVGRHSAASASRIGYSAIHEKVNGAIRPANKPPTMPPNDSAT